MPSAIFFSQNEDATLQELHRMLFNLPGDAGGQEIWLRGDELEDDYGYDDLDDGYDDDYGDDEARDELSVESQTIPVSRMPAPKKLATGFLLQFSESFAPVNLGDSGQMYVYGGDAFGQCY